MNGFEQVPQVEQPEKAVAHISSWSVRMPFLGETEDQWLFRAENPECPVEDVAIRKSVIPFDIGEMVITVVILPKPAEEPWGEQQTVRVRDTPV